MRGAWGSDDWGMETGEVRATWSGGLLGVRSSTENGRVVAVPGAPEALVVGKPKVPKAVTGNPEVVDVGIPKVPTTLSGGCLGVWLCADA